MWLLFVGVRNTTNLEYNTTYTEYKYKKYTVRASNCSRLMERIAKL